MGSAADMSTKLDRRSRKRLATRQAISNAATRLFIERGFDKVTVDQIADAADVGRMTVFNHFPRKEDMFFDLDEVGRADLTAALERRDPPVAPIEALRLFAHRAVAEEKPYVNFFPGSLRYVETIESSPQLKSRAREIRDELAQAVAHALAAAAGRPEDDLDARLAASMLMAAWTTAMTEAHKVFRTSNDAKRAQEALLAIADKGCVALTAMLARTSYTEAAM